MADAGDAAETADKLEAAISKMSATVDMLNATFSRMRGSLSDSDTALANGLKQAEGAAKSASKSAEDMGNSFRSISMSEFVKQVKSGFDSATGAAIRFGADFMKVMNDAMDDAGEFGDVLKSSLSIVGAVGQLDVLKHIPTVFHDAQKSMYEVNKQASQLIVSFSDLSTNPGAGFKERADMIEQYRDAFVKAMRTTRTSTKDMLAAQKGFSDLGMLSVTPLTELQKTLTGVSSQTTMLNTALLVSKATGVDSGNMAEFMTETYLNLNMSMADTVAMFGHIKDASDRSGLSFQTTAKTIQGLSKDLKFWGTTVDNIAPLFKTFAASLQGIGQVGLTPDLLQSFVSGIRQMTFGTRALLGMQGNAGRGGAGGALGAGLRMEQAIEEGDFEQIAGNLTQTLRQFGGQRILTRKEAVDNPALQRLYIIQRQLVGQMTNISDPAQQNHMLRLLRDIDQHGMKGTEGAEDALNELLGSGEEIADSTTTAIEKAEQTLDMAIQTSGTTIVKAIEKLYTSAGVGSVAKELRAILEDAAQTGELDTKMIERELESIKSARATEEKKLERTDLSKGQRTEIERRVGELSAKEQLTKAMSDIGPAFEKALHVAVASGKISKGEANRFIQGGKVRDIENLKTATVNNVLTDINKRLGAIDRERAASSGMLSADKAAEYAMLKSQKVNVSKMLDYGATTTEKGTFEEEQAKTTRAKLLAGPTKTKMPEMPEDIWQPVAMVANRAVDRNLALTPPEERKKAEEKEVKVKITPIIDATVNVEFKDDQIVAGKITSKIKEVVPEVMQEVTNVHGF